MPFRNGSTLKTYPYVRFQDRAEGPLTGDPFSAQQAFEIGLVNSVVAPGDLMTTARGLMDRVIVHSATAITAVLRALAGGIDRPIAEGLMAEAEQFGRLALAGELDGILRHWIDRPRKPHGAAEE